MQWRNTVIVGPWSFNVEEELEGSHTVHVFHLFFQSIMEDGEAVGVEYSPLRTNGTFILAYVMWYRLLTTIALPFTLMLFFNIKVFSYYKQNK